MIGRVAAAFGNAAAAFLIFGKQGIHSMLDMLAPQLPQAKNAKPEQFVDLSFLQELEKDGFLAEMAEKYPTKG